MGKNPKVLIALVVIIVLAVLGFVVSGSIIVGAGAAIVGILAMVVILRRLAVGSGGSGTKDRGFLESDEEEDQVAEPLATWELPTRPVVRPEEIVWDDSGFGDTGFGDTGFGDSGFGDTGLAEINPLDEFSTLDDVDVVAELERLEKWDSGDEWAGGTDWDRLADDTSGASIDLGPLGVSDTDTDGEVIEVNFDSHVVNEDVENSDDIMAASQATELAGEPDNSELARLLAKVQARLAAYE